MAKHSLRFDDSILQMRFISELLRKRLPFQQRDDQSVECSEAEWATVNNVAHTIRDSFYECYFTWLPNQEMSDEFHALLRNSGLPFILEHHRDRDVFCLPRKHQTQFKELGWRVYDAHRKLEA